MTVLFFPFTSVSGVLLLEEHKDGGMDMFDSDNLLGWSDGILDGEDDVEDALSRVFLVAAED